jgi:hypothetical protein
MEKFSKWLGEFLVKLAVDAMWYALMAIPVTWLWNDVVVSVTGLLPLSWAWAVQLLILIDIIFATVHRGTK